MKKALPAERSHHDKLLRQTNEASDLVQTPPRKLFDVLRDKLDGSTFPELVRFPGHRVAALQDVSNTHWVRNQGNKAFDDLKLSRKTKDFPRSTLNPTQATQVKDFSSEGDYEAWGTAECPDLLPFKRPSPPSRICPKKESLQTRSRYRQGLYRMSPIENGVTKAINRKPDPFAFESNPERRTHFEFSLARLEGRISPRSPSPIRRYVDPRGHYSDSVEWERDSSKVFQPIPQRLGKTRNGEVEAFEEDSMLRDELLQKERTTGEDSCTVECEQDRG